MTVTCPNCSAQASLRKWYEDHRLIEVDVACAECKYHYNRSYGKETIEEGRQ